MRNRRPWSVWLTAAVACATLTACESLPQAGSSAGLGASVGGLAAALGAATGTNGNVGSGGAGGTLGGVLEAVQGASTALKDYTAKEQRQLGVEFSAVLLGARPLLPNKAAQLYVNQVGGWVAQQAPLPKDKDGNPIRWDWRFGIIDSHTVNAYATPGGFVFITSGLLRQIKNEAELAGVLAHEIAHVVRGHYLAAIKKGGFAQIAGGVIQAKTGNTQISSAVVGMVRNIYTKGLDRADEYDADRMGMLYAARAGYAPTGLPSVLHMYASQSSQNADYALFFSTHPAPKDRLSQLEPLLESHFSNAAQQTNAARFLAMQRKL